MKVEDYARNQPAFDLFDYFEGDTKAYGIFEDRFGTVRRQFVVDIEGTEQDGTLTLKEDFFYADGEQDQRIWRIRQEAPGRYTGKADDVIGQAQGAASGNALHWRYDLNLKVGEGTWRVHFDDWMFLQPDGVLLNRARVSKWGVEIGQVTLSFKKPANDGQ